MNKETGGPVAAKKTVFFVRFSSEDDGYCVYHRMPNEARDKYVNGPYETYDEAEFIRRLLQDNVKE